MGMLFEGSVEAFQREESISPERIYTPKEINDRIFVLRNETMAAMSDAELEYARLDERSTRFPYSSALRRCLTHLEAVATICVDGVKPDLKTMLLIEALRLAEEYGHSSTASLDEVVPEREHNAAVAAVRYSNVLHRISMAPIPFEFDVDMLLELHRDLLYERDEDVEVHFRRKPYRIRFDLQDKTSTVYYPPNPERIPDLISDLMSFCSSAKLSPVTQAAIAHFHLEAIRPFKTGMDRTGRALAHAIMRSRKVYEHIIPPIALVPAMNIPNHADLLFPYRIRRNFTDSAAAIALDRWCAHCARCMELSVSAVLLFMRQIEEIEEDWASRAGNVRAGSAVDILMRELPGMPIVTVASAMALTGKGFSAANEAVNHLVNVKILRPLKRGQRNRCFEAPQVIALLRAIEQNAIPTELVSRESFVSQRAHNR